MSLHSIKNQLEMMTCLKHGKHPKITIKGQSFSIDCCCDEFKQQIINKSEELVLKSIEEDTIKQFKNL
ncbi:MAG: hypothetical protein ACTTJH_00740 [Bacteroidales bacterium]